MSLTRTALGVMGVLVLLVLLSAIGAFAAANVIPPSSVGIYSEITEPLYFRPDECSALPVNNIVIGSGGINGTNQSDLILGSPGDDSIDAKNGNDCVVGGAGNDTLYGKNGADVLLGGEGDDYLDGGNNKGDVCYGGPGWDTAVNCETFYQD
mgnify:FL=1